MEELKKENRKGSIVLQFKNSCQLKYIHECAGCGADIYRTSWQEKNMTPYCINCTPKYRKTTRIPLTEEGKKKCNICQRFLELELFLKNQKTMLYSASCSKCHNLKKYGINSLEYEEILLSQQGVCAICGNSEPCNDKHQNYKRALAVDHCHENGKVRGLLCTHCNTALGALKDDISLLESAISYLKTHQSID